MEIITKTYEVYKFEELSEEVKEQLIEEQSEKEYESFCEWELETLMNEDAVNLLESIFGEKACSNVVSMYDLSYSQGSGAMIQFDIYLEDANKKLKIFTDKEMEIFKCYGSLIKVYHNDNWYYHERSFAIDTLELNYSLDYAFNNEEITEKKYNKLEEKIEKFENAFYDMVYDINKEHTKVGYGMLEDTEYFKERAEEWLSCNENLYLKDGEIF